MIAVTDRIEQQQFMCGIFGYFSFSNEDQFDSKKIADTIEDMLHRGPDGHNSVVGDGFVLCHTRLSFLDLSNSASQPMWDAERRYCIVYNGEIYNYMGLRNTLEADGYQFQTESDTEVLLAGLIATGVSFLKSVRGMFAFGIYDSVEKTLVLGRDRFGIKPLYFTKSSAGYSFSSEMRPLRHWISMEPNHLCISGYLAGKEIPMAGPTLFANVEVCPVGHTIQIKRCGAISTQSFCQVNDFADRSCRNRFEKTSARGLISELDSLLQEAVEDHMIADVPIGALCSGGLDSSLIVHYASQVRSDLAIFHADVVGKYSERAAAESLAKHLKLDLNVIEVRDQDVFRLIPDTLTHYEYPFSYHPNSIPFLAVANLVKEHNVKAVLTGEGADECFLGYSSIPTRKAIQNYYSVLDVFRTVIRTIPKLGPLLWRNPSQELANISLLTGLNEEVDAESVVREICEVGAGSQRSLDLLGYHLQTLLHRNDRLGMAASIEARFPYLDHRVVHFAVNLPDKYKIRFSIRAGRERTHPFVFTKWILRKVAQRHLPADLANRRKLGFPTSIFERLRIDTAYFAGGWVADVFSLDERKLNYLMEKTPPSFHMKLFLLEGWARLHLLGKNIQELQKDIEIHAAVSPE